MGANPVKVKQWAFGIATAVLGIAGALLIIVAPVEPTLDRAYIGRTFCVVVMAGLGSITGTLIAAIILGVAESIVLTLFGASWAPAISFAMLLGVLAIPSTAVAMPNAHCLTLTGLAPISRSASWSCATARIARPMNVFDRYSASKIVSAAATANATSSRTGIRISPIRQALPI
jgi:hypothetical protein